MNRVVSFFGFPKLIPSPNNTVKAKGNEILNDLRFNAKRAGPYSSDIQIDFLQYLIDDFFERRSDYERGTTEYNPWGPSINFNNAFIINHSELANCLKRDGYTVEGKTIRKLLPEEITEAQIESELVASLDKYGFSTSKGHLTQGIQNHSQGNWAAANAQFRAFIESLLVDISKVFVPENNAKTFAQAAKLLVGSVNPPFLSVDLNEIPKDENSDSFVYGIWVRLHPDGSHPGLSDEDDCSFRYHISIVFANYLLRRLLDRKKSAPNSK